MSSQPASSGIEISGQDQPPSPRTRSKHPRKTNRIINPPAAAFVVDRMARGGGDCQLVLPAIPFTQAITGIHLGAHRRRSFHSTVRTIDAGNLWRLCRHGPRESRFTRNSHISFGGGGGGGAVGLQISNVDDDIDIINNDVLSVAGKITSVIYVANVTGQATKATKTRQQHPEQSRADTDHGRVA